MPKYTPLTDDEKAVIQELNHPIYGVDFVEHWINRNDNIVVNAPSALQAMGAKGFHTAVKQFVKNKLLQTEIPKTTLHSIQLVFLENEGPVTLSAIIKTPNTVSTQSIYHTLKEIHEFLDKEDTAATYKNHGRTPETLLNYTCKKQDWI